MWFYNNRDLKIQFPELKKEEDKTIIPLMDAIIRKFLFDLKTEPIRFGIDGLKDTTTQEDESSFSDSYELTVNGIKVVSRVNYTNLDIVNHGGIYFLRSSISFEAKGYPVIEKELFIKLAKFISVQNFGELIHSAAAALRESGVLNNLSEELRHFYGV